MGERVYHSRTVRINKEMWQSLDRIDPEPRKAILILINKYEEGLM